MQSVRCTALFFSQVLRAVQQSLTHPIYINSPLIFTLLEAFVFVSDLCEHLWQAGWSEALIGEMASNNALATPDRFPFQPNATAHDFPD